MADFIRPIEVNSYNIQNTPLFFSFILLFFIIIIFLEGGEKF